MADKNTPKSKTPGKPSAQKTDPNDIFGGDDPLDLSELDSILDDSASTDFPASDTGLGVLPEPPPLPPTEEMTANAVAPPLRPEDDFDDADGMELAVEELAEPRDAFDVITSEGSPRGVRRDDAIDSASWEVPASEDALLAEVANLTADIQDETSHDLGAVTREADRRLAAEKVDRETEAAEEARRVEAVRELEIDPLDESKEMQLLADESPEAPAEAAPVIESPRAAPPRPAAAPPPQAAEEAEVSVEFRRESQRLARARDWKKLAELTTSALDEPWASTREIRATLLADLGRIQRDRLNDIVAAEKSFTALVHIEPAHVDGFEFVAQAYEYRSEWRKLYELLLAAVEATWDPGERLSWTRRAVNIAEGRLLSAELSIEAWERLAKLGDAVEETTSALSDAYRAAGRWDRLTDFLERGAELVTGAARRLQLREAAEASLSGLRDAERASIIIDRLLGERAEDPISLLMRARVEARRRNWDALFTLGTRSTLKQPNGTPDGTTTNDLRRIAADALAAGGENDRAATVYDLILSERPGDLDAISAKERYLTQSGRIAELVDFLAARAGQAEGEEKGKLLARAAEIAERDLGKPARAVELWEARARLPDGRVDALRALEALHETLGDDQGLRRDLEEQLELSPSTAQRIELLRRLGRHAAHRLEDDALAERCWTEILRTVPDDRGVREELIALYRRRGDFAALDRTLDAQGWRPAEDTQVRSLWRAAAQNVDDNLSGTGRGGAAWRRVLDLEPGDPGALSAVVRHERAAAGNAAGGDGRSLISALEAELASLGSGAPERVALGLEIAARWEQLDDKAAASAAYERVLWWSPIDKTAIDRLLALRAQSGGNPGVAILDRAAAELPVDSPERLALVRRQIDLVPKEDALGRFYAWRRLYRLAGPEAELVKQMTATATAAGAFRDLEAVLIDLAARSEGEARRRFHANLADLYKHLGDPLRALLALTSARHEAVVSLSELEPALALCETTSRFEDAYALLGVATRKDVPAATRTEAIQRRITLAEERLADPERAFHECARLLEQDPQDHRALQTAKRLAGEKKLGRALDALFGELGDRAESAASRGAITRERYELRVGELGDAAGALDQLWLLYHLVPAKETEALLFEQGGAQRAWDRVLSVVEARARAGVHGEGLAPLSSIAKMHETERNDPERALELSATALTTQPGEDSAALEATVERLAASTGRWGWLVDSFRSAAARSSDPGRALTLYRKVAGVYADKLAAPELALDVHRRILQLDGNDLGSLEMAIAHLRSSELWRELRDALSHWLDIAAASDPDRSLLIQRLLTVAAISRDRLGDPEQALTTFAHVLEIDATNALALEGIASLTGGAMTPELESRRLRLELQRADETSRTALTLRIAALHDEKLDDRRGAITVLEQLVESTGAAGPGYEPLRRLYEKDKAWKELVDLYERHATATQGDARVQALSDALTLAETHPAEAGMERKERLCRLLVEARPDDVEARRRLLSLLRESGRFEELADRLEETLRKLGEPEDDDMETHELRGLIEAELVQLLERKLDKPADAEALLRAQIERRPSDRPEALLELAGLRLRQGDVAGYISLRQQHTKQLPQSIAAYVLCHLAEAADEKLNDQNKVLDLYREARVIDPSNPSAMEALKAVGRRAKNWRAGAALLPDPDERELSWRDRSRRLLDRAAAARATDPMAARMWVERAIATDADNHEGWTELAKLARARHDVVDERYAARAATFAFVRAAGGDPSRQAEQATRVLAYSDTLRKHAPTLSARLAWHAYELKSTLPSAALRVAGELLEQGRDSLAYTIYDRLLATGAALQPSERLEATFRRGALRSRLGDHLGAIADFRDGLRIEELHPPLLTELAQVLAASGRMASAALHCIQALLLSSDPVRRADLYARLGRLFEGPLLEDEDEAGVAYDRAMFAGSMDPQVMLRALGHYRRKGEIDRALGVIESLLPATRKPEDLAALWAERGRLLADRDTDKAVEAFDMALSYDSSCAPAVAGLAAVLEGRGDWTQLLELLEVRAEQGAPEERADALRGLARIAAGHLDDAKRADGYLRQAIALAPRKEDYESLLATYGDDPLRRGERRDIVAALIAMGGPLMSRVVELGRELVVDGHRQWAWSLLAPLMNTTLSEPTLKSLVLELRKEFEKAETVGRLSPRTHELVRPQDVPQAAFDVLVEVSQLGAVGPTSLEGITLGKLDGRTAVGKTFLALAERLGIEGAQLFRAQELASPYVILDGPTPQVVLRADLVQLMAPGETNFLFTMVLEEARAGTRLVTSLPHEQRALFLPAMLQVLGLGTAPAAAAELVTKLDALIPADRRLALAARLPEADRSRLGTAVAGARFAEGLVETARRVALVAAADLRFAAKVLTRLDDSLPRMPTAGRMEDLDEFFMQTGPVRALVSFAASSQFKRALEP
ncbi:MAG: hypothetical protein ABI321_11535 [Polyangia bacterium]